MTNLHHNLHPGMLDDADVSAVAALTPEELSGLLDLLEQDGTLLKARKDKIVAAFDRRYGETLRKKRLEVGKDTGLVHVEDGGFDVAADTSKTVKWDQTKLVAALDAMPPDIAKHYAKAEFKVDERKYAAAPPDIQKRLAPARAVVAGKTTYTLTPKTRS
jgi:hypothetical protein